MAKAKKEELQEDLPVEIGTVNKDSIRAINSVKMALKKKYGDDVFSEKTIAAMPSISTGSALIDAEIGNSGLVLGRLHEIYGDTGSGKTTLATLIAANALEQYPDKYILCKMPKNVLMGENRCQVLNALKNYLKEYIDYTSDERVYDLFSIDKKGKVEDEMKERIGSKKYIMDYLVK